MPTVVLDTNALQQDWLCTGLRFELLRHSRFSQPLDVVVPAPVLEELVANHAREVRETLQSRATTQRKLARMGVAVSPDAVADFDYRRYLLERFDEIFGITVLDWPEVDHASIVARAVGRIPPFDQKGSGYRDTLVWADVIRIAESGRDVALVSQDRVFGAGGTLDPSLAAEAEALTATSPSSRTSEPGCLAGCLGRRRRSSMPSTGAGTRASSSGSWHRTSRASSCPRPTKCPSPHPRTPSALSASNGTATSAALASGRSRSEL